MENTACPAAVTAARGTLHQYYACSTVTSPSMEEGGRNIEVAQRRSVLEDIPINQAAAAGTKTDEEEPVDPHLEAAKAVSEAVQRVFPDDGDDKDKIIAELEKVDDFVSNFYLNKIVC